MPLNHYVTLGRSGLRVSPFCLGAMTFGEEWGFGCDARSAAQILDYYIEQGGNFVDTANLYTGGTSERILGDYMRRSGFRRDRLVLASKFSGNMFPGDPNGGGANRKSIIAACEASLQRLQTDYLDLYWQHWEDPFTPLEETLYALDLLVKSGKIRYAGFSDTSAWKCSAAQLMAQFRGWAPLVALQIEYSLIERTVEGELIPMAQAMGLGVTPWSPLRSGVLSGKYSRNRMTAESKGREFFVSRNANERVYALLEVLAAVAKRRATNCARVALAWLLRRPAVSSPILGVRTLEQLQDNLAALELQLDAADIAELDQASAPTLNFPAEFLKIAGAQSYGGMSINGQTFPASMR